MVNVFLTLTYGLVPYQIKSSDQTFLSPTYVTNICLDYVKFPTIEKAPFAVCYHFSWL